MLAWKTACLDEAVRDEMTRQLRLALGREDVDGPCASLAPVVVRLVRSFDLHGDLDSKTASLSTAWLASLVESNVRHAISLSNVVALELRLGTRNG